MEGLFAPENPRPSNAGSDKFSVGRKPASGLSIGIISSGIST